MRELKALLFERFGRDIDKIILFGSQANGNAGKDSDYDVLIILAGGYDWRYEDKITSVLYEFELEHDIFIDAKIVSRQEINRNTVKARHPLVRNAITSGVYA